MTLLVPPRWVRTISRENAGFLTKTTKAEKHGNFLQIAGIVGVRKARKIAWPADMSTNAKIANFVSSVDFVKNAQNAANAETAFAVQTVSGVPNVRIAFFA
jgi:hypothetical protein